MTVLPDKTLRDAMQLNAVVPLNMDTWPYVHNTMVPHKTVNWYGTDHETLYKRNLRNLPDDWMYRDEKNNFTYTFNKQGLRMNKDVEEVQGDYIMYAGTSYTMGLGVAEENRFSNLVNKQTGIDFINVGGPTFTIKCNAMSFFNFLKTAHRLPKVFVLEYHKADCYTFYTSNNYVHIHSSFKKLKHLPEGKEYENFVEAYKLINETDYFLNEAKMYRGMIKATCERLGIKFLELSFVREEEFVQELNIPYIDIATHQDDINYALGRDVRVRLEGYYSHPGVGFHKEAANIVLKGL